MHQQLLMQEPMILFYIYIQMLNFDVKHDGLLYDKRDNFKKERSMGQKRRTGPSIHFSLFLFFLFITYTWANLYWCNFSSTHTHLIYWIPVIVLVKLFKRLALWVKNSTDDILKYFFLISLRKQVLTCHQTVSKRDNLHEMPNPVFWEK